MMDLIRDRNKGTGGATFEMLGRGGETNQAEVMKYPIKRVEVTIQKFIKVLQMDLERLTKHQNNILKFQRLGDFEALNKEQMNASRTVQQLSSNLKQLNQTRKQVQDDDLEKFDGMTCKVKDTAVSDLQDFLRLHGQQAPGLGVNDLNVELKPFDTCCMRQRASESGPDQAGGLTTQLSEGEETSVAERHMLEAQCAQAEQSWLELEQNLADLNDVMRDFSNLVHDQQQTVDTIEEKVEESQVNVHQGTSYLAEAAKYKGSLLPVLGAVIGGSLGGPVGIIAGLKIGGVAALGGGLMGLTGGALLKKRRESLIQEDMDDIQERERQTDDAEKQGLIS